MANMFRCVLASGGALILTVTTDSTFAGQTITCTDGTTTLTQICPSTSPYTVEFKIPNGGTWTISSGTASTSVTIPSSAELHDIPNGSTITPINDIQIWLHCANIWDKSYTTITQVLNDASTLQALIASNNAADYMARSTTWASSVTANQTAMSNIGLNNYCANKLLANSTWRTAICNSTYFESVLNVKVPTMTSNTTPSGEAFADSTKTNAWKAFDGNDETQPDGGGGTEHYFGYDFGRNVQVLKFSTKCYGGSTKNAVQWSDNKTSWTDAQTYTESQVGGNTLKTFNINNVGAHRYWRFYISNSASFTGMCYTLQFYGRA